MAGRQQALSGGADHELLSARRGLLRGRDDPGGAHAFEHDALALRCTLEVGDRVGVVGVLRQAGQHRGLADRQLVERLAEVHVRRCSEAVGALAEEDLVQIQLEDLVLGKILLDLECNQDLARLAFGREALLEEEGTRHLLRDRRRALAPAAGQQRQRGACHAARVDAAVLAKARVLDRDHSVLQPLGHLRDRHEGAALGAEGGDLDAIGREHRQRLLGLVVEHAVERRDVPWRCARRRAGQQQSKDQGKEGTHGH